MRLEFVLCLGLTAGACVPPVPKPTPTPRTGSRVTQDPPRAGALPTHGGDRIRAELGRLNRWCSGQDDCDVVERPKAYPGRAAHGETRGFIDSAKSRLRNLGAEVRWNAVKNQYRLLMASGTAPPTAPVVRTRADVARHHGRSVDLVGRYHAVVMPSKRPSGVAHPKEYAFIELADKTVVYLGKYNTPLARRPTAERRRCDGKKVCVRGMVHRICPSAGQAPSAACLTAIHKVNIVTP